MKDGNEEERRCEMKVFLNERLSMRKRGLKKVPALGIYLSLIT